MNFVDKTEVKIVAGRGGDGTLSFHHERYVAKGGPDGGDGGDGGSVVMVASRNQNTLAAFRYKKLLKAQDGERGGNAKRHGKTGQDLVLEVPVGTVLMQEEEIIADLKDDGQQIIVAKGGKGGYGNAHFVSSRRQTPRLAEKGEPGESLDATLELKMIADAGIIGLPNAGKSTLLSVISNAKPEVADYPFTTLAPYLGVVDIDGDNSLLFADIPGLIAGASQGKGLGDEFLRHVERTSVFIHLIDAYNEDIDTAYKTIMKELKDYKVDLSGRPQVVVLTKTEGLDKDQVAEMQRAVKKRVPTRTPVMAISSLSKDGLKELLRAVLKAVGAARAKAAKAAEKEELPVIGLKEDEDIWQIKEEDDVFIVTGKKIERFAHRTHFGDFHGEERLRDIMGKLGILSELSRRGAQAGQKISIGRPAIGKIEY